ncbi:MAG: hypothetical protein IJ025_01820 [Clostridia bacterium]|nr:hypothetical protein [Clostridia bacterium]
MKKIIAFCSLILCVSLLLTVFVSCGKDDNEETTNAGETNIVSVTNGEFVFSAEIGAESTVIKNNDEEYQTLKYPVNAGYPFDLEYAKNHYEFIDMNFDGQPDFYIAVSTSGDVIYYYCWLFNATTQKFDYAVLLSGLNNISVDSENQVIYSSIKQGDTFKIASYVWVNGQLTFKEVYDTEDDTIPEDVTQAAQDNAIGTVTKPAKTTAAATKTTQGNKDNTVSEDKGTTSTTRVNDKPLDTTTTEPHTNGVQIATGDIDDGWF